MSEDRSRKNRGRVSRTVAEAVPIPIGSAPVGIALVRKPTGELLWVRDGEWDCFALPVAKLKKGEHVVELPDRAARRVGARALGVPVRIGRVWGHETVTGRKLSRSEQADTFYCHGVFEGTVLAGTAFASAGPVAVDGRPASDDSVSPAARRILEDRGHVPLLGSDVG